MSELNRVPTHASGLDRVTAADIQGLAKVVAVSSFRIGAWATKTGLKTSRRVIDVARNPEKAGEFVEDVRTAAAAVSRALAGEDGAGTPPSESVRPPVTEARGSTERVVTIPWPSPSPEATAPPTADPERRSTDSAPAAEPAPPGVEVGTTASALHQAGQDLLRRTRDVWADDRGHPAYARIIEQLAPDEARILLLLLKHGPQASVDVRGGGMMGSTSLVASNLTMIGARSGLRYVERVPSYLHNLERLGLVWFSAESLKEGGEYQLLEDQPEVFEALHSSRRAKTVRRSIHLTPFGEDFCKDGLGLDAAALAAVPLT